MTYGPMSTSYYTTSSDSIGLTSVTALTEISTTGESYLTQVTLTRSIGTFRQYYTSPDADYGNYSATYIWVLPYITKTSTNNSWIASWRALQAENSNNPVGTHYITSKYQYGGSGTRSATSTYVYFYVGFTSNSFVFTNTTANVNIGQGYAYSLQVSNEVATTGTSYLTAETTTGYSGIFSSIQSGSSSWYTSNINSEGMYDTTALTEISTTGTEYLTTGSTTWSYARANYWYSNNSYYMYYSYSYPAGVYRISSRSTYQSYDRTYGRSDFIIFSDCESASRYTYTLTSSNHVQRTSISNTRTGMQYSNYQGITYNSSLFGVIGITAKDQAIFLSNDTFIINMSYNSYNTDYICITLSSGAQVSTTGTSYLTEEVTNGYSGISSSSSIAYDWM